MYNRVLMGDCEGVDTSGPLVHRVSALSRSKEVTQKARGVVECACVLKRPRPDRDALQKSKLKIRNYTVCHLNWSTLLLLLLLLQQQSGAHLHDLLQFGFSRYH